MSDNDIRNIGFLWAERDSDVYGLDDRIGSGYIDFSNSKT